VPVPADLVRRAVSEAGRKPGVGVYAITDPIREWLKEQLGA
jgi:hypothetical protein